MTDDEIEVPPMVIDGDWTGDDLETDQDCQDAIAVLTAAIIAIEEKVGGAKEKGTNKGDPYRRLTSALRWKRTALAEVQRKRGEIARMSRISLSNERDKRLLKALRRIITPEQWDQAEKEVANERR
jgi:hypothetical protein